MFLEAPVVEEVEVYKLEVVEEVEVEDCMLEVVEVEEVAAYKWASEATV